MPTRAKPPELELAESSVPLSISPRRRWLAGGIAVAFFVFSLLMLLSGLFEGGAFVSLFTVGLVVAGVSLVAERITQVSLWGYDIELQRRRAASMTQAAEQTLADLESCRVDMLESTLLNLNDDLDRGHGECADLEHRVALLERLLTRIEAADLLETLAEPAYRATEATTRIWQGNQTSREPPPGDIERQRWERLLAYRERARRCLHSPADGADAAT
ncbi:hypothetical protein [Salinicola avicenniae]|uniref:hypothetical protein n=1 Tax=Salinicola avicenniae TaxID=2916836 RepID=UPI0020739C9D|nr:MULTISPECIES: hypothetical protein [unclassified Salinicola]